MKHLLSKSALPLLEQLAWSNALLVFDFDGTLAPLVDDRDAARMRESTARLFHRACSLYPCGVLSGRERADIAARLDDACVRYVVGNHGLEPGTRLPAYARAIAAAKRTIERESDSRSGLDLEDKTYSLTVHYRTARQARLAEHAVTAAMDAAPGAFKVIAGKRVLNLVPADAVNKGGALLSMRARARADIALYVGDDVTDEDVFELDQPGRLLTVRVGRSRTSAAAYFVRSQLEVDAMLEHLVAFRLAQRP